MRHAEISRQALVAKLSRIAARDIFQLLARWTPEVGFPGKLSAELGRQVESICRCDSRQYFGHASCRSEEHTSELQSQSNLVCRLLLEKKKNKVRRESGL